MTVLLLGGGEWNPAASEVDGSVLRAGMTVALIAAAAAFEDQAAREAYAIEHFRTRDMQAIAVPVMAHHDAMSAVASSVIDSADAVYIGDGSAMHLRSVLRNSLVWQAVATAHGSGKPVVASGAGAEVVCDPMVDPRGGGFTVGLGLVTGLSVIAAAESWSSEKTRRCAELAPADLPIAALPTGAAVLVANAGPPWTTYGDVTWWLAGRHEVLTGGPESSRFGSGLADRH